MVLLFAFALSACGPQGPVGPQGPQGIQGIPGVNGAQGLTGASGSSCTVSTISPSITTPYGGSMILCSDGTNSLVSNGAPGSNGTLATVVQFCTGNAVQSYPNVFNEIGFCINGSIYAVYSANGGFLSQMLPGGYSSDGINSSCSFTIGANCAISN